MRRSSLILPAAILVAACATPLPPEQPRDVSAEIRLANDALAAAFAQHDGAAAAALYTSDGQVMPPNGEAVTGTDAIGTFWQGVMDSGVASVTLTTDEALGVDSLAFEVGRYAIAGADGTPLDDGKYLVVWRQTPDGWRLYRDIWNSNHPVAE